MYTNLYKIIPAILISKNELNKCLLNLFFRFKYLHILPIFLKTELLNKPAQLRINY